MHRAIRLLTATRSLWLSTALLCGLVVISVLVGKYSISISELGTVLWAKLRGTDPASSTR